jgi:hypothetical protein
MEQEISGVKSFAGFWVNNQWQNSNFYHNNESQLHLKGCAKATRRMPGKHTMITVGHIGNMTNKTIQILMLPSLTCLGQTNSTLWASFKIPHGKQAKDQSLVWI